MASFLDVCRFTAASSGTGDFVVSAAVTGYQTPASAGAVNAAVYRYRAESSDLSQWEVGYGAYTTGSTTLARTTILFSSTGSKVSFSAAPQVSIVALAEDLVTFGDTSTNTTSSVDSEVVLFSGTAGKTLKRASASGIAKLTSGVLSAATADTDYTAPATFNAQVSRQSFIASLFIG